MSLKNLIATFTGIVAHAPKQRRRKPVGNQSATTCNAVHLCLATRCEQLEALTLLSPLGDSAFQLLHSRTTENQGAFYVYLDAGSAFNHGELTLFPAAALSKLHVDASCIFDPTAPGECATDPATLDRDRGSVLHITVAPLSNGEFAGVAIRGTAHVPTGQNLTGATHLVFQGHTSKVGGQRLNIDIGGASVTVTIPGGSGFTTFSIPLVSLGGGSVNTSHQDVLFAAGFSDTQAASGANVFLDNIRFESAPARQQTELSLPLSYESFGVIPETSETIGDQHPIYLPDQVTVNTSTIYESSMTAISLLERGQPQDLADGRRIIDSFVYALAHDVRRADGTPDHAQIPPIADGSRGLHDAYQAGDLATGPGSTAGGQIRLAGFSVGSQLNKYYLVLDGANGGNNSFAIFALLKAYKTFSDVRYLDAARSIGRWIVGALKDNSSLADSFGGFYFGYDSGGAPNNGQSPRVLNRGKSIENNADIFAALSQLASVEKAMGRATDGAFWSANANHAGDFVMRLYDSVSGRFFAGTALIGTPPSEGLDLSGPSRTNEVINIYDFLDAQSFVTLALAASARYRDAIDWRRPVHHMLTTFDQTVTANGQQFQGFSLTAAPTVSFPHPPSATGIAWEFTGQAVATMQFVDALYGESTFLSQIQLYTQEMRRAQTLAPYGDDMGLVASTLDGENEHNSPFLPVNQALTTPFQVIPERVALAATNWAVYVDRAHNIFLPQTPVTVITGPEMLTSAQRPKITWTPVSGAVSYEIWLNNRSTNVSPVLRTTVNGTCFTPTSDLGIGQFDLWVRSVNAAGQNSAWTPKYSFQINTNVQILPIIPPQNPARPQIEWAPVPGAVRYELFIANETTGQSPYRRIPNITKTFWVSPTDFALGAYSVWIRGIDAAGIAAQWSLVVRFPVASRPVLVSPVIPTFNHRPVFFWNPVEGALHYELYLLDLKTGFTKYHQKNITAVSWIPPLDVADGPYRWWVLAVGASSFRSPWSLPADFNVGGQTTLLTPAGSDSDATPTFTWLPVTGASSYRLWVDRTDVFVSRIIDVSGLTMASYTPTVPLPAGTYRAWVRAISSTGQLSPWSIPVTFAITTAGLSADHSNLNSDPATVENADLSLSSVRLTQFMPLAGESRSTETTALPHANQTSTVTVGDSHRVSVESPRSPRRLKAEQSNWRFVSCMLEKRFAPDDSLLNTIVSVNSPESSLAIDCLMAEFALHDLA